MNKKNDDILSILADGPILDWLWPWTALMLIATIFSGEKPGFLFEIALWLLAAGSVLTIWTICVDKFKRIRALHSNTKE